LGLPVGHIASNMRDVFDLRQGYLEFHRNNIQLYAGRRELKYGYERVVGISDFTKHVGNELDIVAEYTLNKGPNFGFGYGRMFAGPFLRTTTAGYDYQYPYAYFEYNVTKSSFHFPISITQPNYW
jgi:hypothetical protein